jgi:hypothetical protein
MENRGYRGKRRPALLLAAAKLASRCYGSISATTSLGPRHVERPAKLRPVGLGSTFKPEVALAAGTALRSIQSYSTGALMTAGASTIAGAKLVVKILARRKRATRASDLIAVFEREGGGGSADFKAAVDHAVLHGWITRRPDGSLTQPRREGLRAAGLL